MPTPFPGMDPYLERASRWHPFHTPLVSEIALTLVPMVAPKYYVSVEERTYIVSGEQPFAKRPDVGIVRTRRTLYLRKRQQACALLTSLVEIDLLRAGQRMPLSQQVTSDYYILVSRGWERPEALLFPFGVREPIPRSTDPAASG